MVKMIGKVSRGSRMDQIYIPKNRQALPVGSYVEIRPLETEERESKLYFYNIANLEPIKTEIIKDIMKTIDQHMINENIMVTGSFLDRGFRFNDIDIMVITESKTSIDEALEKKLKIKVHLITLSKKELMKGLSTDPMFSVMLSRCVAKKRFIHMVKTKINKKLLDMRLLKSKPLIDSFDLLTGNEKYAMLRNLIAIRRFIDKKEVGLNAVDSAIRKLFGSIDKLKENMIPRKDFQKKYRKIFNDTQRKIIQYQ